MNASIVPLKDVLQQRYFMGSLGASKVSPKRFLELVQGDWQVENRLPLIKDRWWDEDTHALFAAFYSI